MLLFVALMPFSSDIVGDFSGEMLGVVFFACNLLIVSLLFLANWAYATYNYRLVNTELDRKMIVSGIRKNSAVSAVSLLVTAFSFIIHGWSLFIYFLIPIILALKPFR